VRAEARETSTVESGTEDEHGEIGRGG